MLHMYMRLTNIYPPVHNEKQNAEKDGKKKGEEKKAETVEAGPAAHDKAWAFQTLDHTYCHHHLL